MNKKLLVSVRYVWPVLSFLTNNVWIEQKRVLLPKSTPKGTALMLDTYERLKGAYAFKSMLDNGAEATFDGDTRGSIKAGKLADIAVCDLNLMEIDPKDILNMNIEKTISI